MAMIFKPKRERRSASTTVFPTSFSGTISLEMVRRSLSWMKSRTRTVSRRFASRMAISRSGYTTSAPSFARISPCSALLALETTLGIPRLTRFSVVRMEVAICSPMQTTATSQFWMPVSAKVFLSRVLTTKAFSVYSRISRTFSSSPSRTRSSAPDLASSMASAYPKRPNPTIP